jgi:hypothetical protein
LRPLVAQAVDDAQHSSSKDFGLSALIVLGTVIVLLKYRPTELDVSKSGLSIRWKENDVAIVKDLIQAIDVLKTPAPGGGPEA